MPKRVFFSFHYKDVINFRANVVRNHWVTKPDREASGYFDASIWETAKKQGDIALKRLINGGLDNTSNTCVLIGSETYGRPWVRYEILKSFKRGNNIFAVHINGINSKDGVPDNLGPNPLEYVGVRYSSDGKSVTLLEKIGPDWIEYEKIDDSATYTLKTVSPYAGNAYTLSQFFSTYKWNADNGFENFSNWVK